MVGPTARARLATDCVTPNTLPCSLRSALLDARLASEGAISALPIEDTVPIARIPIIPMTGPTKGVANKLAENSSAPVMTSGGSPKRFTSRPINPP